jgi:3-dehydroquinate synthase
MGYGNWLHGEAIATGMVMAADLSVRMGWMAESDIVRIKALLEKAALPTQAPNELSPEDFLSLMSVDKKVKEGVIRLVLMKGIGESIITDDYDKKKLEETLSAFHTS